MNQTIERERGRDGVQTQTLNINAAWRREVRAAVHQNLREGETIEADDPAESRQPKLSTMLHNIFTSQHLITILRH